MCRRHATENIPEIGVEVYVESSVNSVAFLAVFCLVHFGDFGVSFVATVAWRYTRRGGPRLSVQGEPLLVLTREP